jgi:hypothetical protein
LTHDAAKELVLGPFACGALGGAHVLTTMRTRTRARVWPMRTRTRARSCPRHLCRRCLASTPFQTSLLVWFDHEQSKPIIPIGKRAPVGQCLPPAHPPAPSAPCLSPCCHPPHTPDSPYLRILASGTPLLSCPDSPPFKAIDARIVTSLNLHTNKTDIALRRWGPLTYLLTYLPTTSTSVSLIATTTTIT